MTDNQHTSNSKRIAKNTLMLYFRMLLTMLGYSKWEFFPK
jgi:hypothetical protein